MHKHAACIWIALIATTLPSLAHDSWISRGGLQGKGQAAGEWCCGAGDCGVKVDGEITARPDGYHVHAKFKIDGTGEIEAVNEIVPYAEAQPSPDGAYWRCHRPDRTRRCFFFPPPNT